jgi:hypothetical protein
MMFASLVDDVRDSLTIVIPAWVCDFQDLHLSTSENVGGP